uniref:Uncharacterized protein n=1 Tax=Sinocyclocheilus grahami TaxID=75366 RepID=A0A672S1U4_SINGR
MDCHFQSKISGPLKEDFFLSLSAGELLCGAGFRWKSINTLFWSLRCFVHQPLEGQMGLCGLLIQVYKYITLPQNDTKIYLKHPLKNVRIEVVIYLFFHIVTNSNWLNCSLGCFRQFQMSEVFCLYLYSLDGKDAAFLDTMLYAGCEVHRFDPSGRGSRELASIKNHRAWLDWRNPHRHAGLVGNVQHRLLDIMDSLGHTMVDVLRMDLESAEWRILESWIKDGTLRRINQLILTIHMQWAGFEVGGAEEEVVRFWYSVLRTLRISGLQLVHSAHGPGHIVLRHKLANSHSSYTLSWIRTSEQPR